MFKLVSKWGILRCRFTVWPLGGSLRSRSNCQNDQKHIVPLHRVSLLGFQPAKIVQFLSHPPVRVDLTLRSSLQHIEPSGK